MGTRRAGFVVAAGDGKANCMDRFVTRQIWPHALVLLAVVCVSVAAIGLRGPWYDEFYTIYAADPTLGFMRAASERWLPDNHPPLYYALVWAAGWTGETMESRRLVNVLVLLAGAGALAWLAYIRPAFRAWSLPYVIALASFASTIEQIAQLRSNYLAYVAAAVLAAALATIAHPDSPAPRRREWITLALALSIAFNVHFTATLITGSLGIAFGCWLLLRRDWRRAGGLAIAAALAAMPFLALLALQFGRIEANTRDFWIPAGLDAARWTIQQELTALLTDNLAITVVGMMGLGYLAMATWKECRPRPDAQLVLVLGAGAILAVGLLLALHVWRPIVIGRYLVALAPIAGVALAVGATTILDRVGPLLRRATVVVMLLFLALSLHQKLEIVRSMTSWNDTARPVGAMVARCSGTVVHAALHWNAFTLDLPPTGNRRVVPLAYRIMAQRNGFAVDDPSSRRMANDCPTIFWAEHVAGQDTRKEQAVRQLRHQGYAVGRDTQMIRRGDGWILISRP